LGNPISSNTGELLWDYADEGFVTLDTPGTQGMVGFASGLTHEMSDLALTVETPFAVALVTATERGGNIATSDRLLLTTMARARNTGMRYNESKTELLEVGEAPILLEPVKLTLQLPDDRSAPVIHVLDHGGVRTGRTLPVEQGRGVIDGEATQAIYYELSYVD